MANREIYTGLAVEQIIDPEVLSADKNSSEVDMQDFDSVLLAVSVGTAGDTWSGTDKIELEVEEADDDGSGSPDTWSDVDDEDLLAFVSADNDGTFGALEDDGSDDEQVYITGYRGNKQYVRVVANFSGTHSTGTPISAVAVLGHARSKPVNEPS